MTSFNKKLKNLLSKKISKVVLGIILVLVLIRAALPFLIQDYVNKKLDKIPDYEGSIGDVDLSFIRGAYEVEDIQIRKTTGNVPVPFFSAKKLDFSLQWRALFEGALVGEIHLNKPELNFVDAPTKEQEQKKIDKKWTEVVRELFPFQINHFRVRDGTVHFRNYHSQPTVDISVDSLYIRAENLTNSKNISDTLAATADFQGRVLKSAGFFGEMAVDPFADQPRFSLNLSLENLELVRLNDVFRSYLNLDIEEGTFQLYAEMAAAEGRFEGYIKPIFKNMQILEWKSDKEKNVFKLAWETIMEATTELFENQPREQVATRVELTGEFDDPETDIWTSIVYLVRNAFIRALAPGIEGNVNIEDVLKDK